MSGGIVLRPGLASLADWRAIYRGADVTLDPVSRADVEAGTAALQKILAAKGAHPPPRPAGRPPVVETLHKANGPLPAALVRLFFALKLASLAQGAAGMRWASIERLAGHLSQNSLPVIPERDAGDDAALAYVAALLNAGGATPAGRARTFSAGARKAKPDPFDIGVQENAALLSGTQMSTAFALAGLFEAERVFQSALVAAAFSAEAAGAGPIFLHPRVHALRRHRGQIDVAAAMRALLTGAAEATGADQPDEPAHAGCAPRMGACLDLLRQAGRTLEREANAVAEDRLVIWQSGEIRAGIEDASATALAADLVALALREIGGLSGRRIEGLRDSSAIEVQGGDAGATTPQATAASFIAENRMRGQATGIADEPPNDGHGAAATGVRRLLPMAGNAALIVAIEFLTAARTWNRHEPERRNDRFDALRKLLGDAMSDAGAEDGIGAAALANAADLVRSGALAAAPGLALPEAVSPSNERTVTYPGARRKQT